MRGLLLLSLAVTPAIAQEMRPAPDYFVDTAMRTTTANVLAVNCPTLSVDLEAISRLSGEVLERLAADGFTQQRLAEEMADPSQAIAVLQDAFLEKHDLATGAPQAAVCAAGRAEIAEGTGIGVLLLEVGE